MEEVSVFIRDAREDDLPRLAEIETVCFTHPWTEGAFRWSTEEGKRLLTACAGAGAGATFQMKRKGLRCARTALPPHLSGYLQRRRIPCSMPWQ